MAIIPNCSHLYATAKWSGVPNGSWSGESWQIGIRLSVSPTIPDTSSGVIDLGAFEVQDAAVTRTVTGWDVDAAWSGVSQGLNTITDSDQDDIVNALILPFSDHNTQFSSQYQLEVVKLYAVHKAADGRWLSGAPNAYFRTSALIGSAAAMLPADSAAVMSFYSATRGVKGRGRVYLGGLAQAVLENDGRFKVDFQNALGQGFADMFSDIRAINDGGPGYRYAPMIWHRPGDKAGLEDGTRGSIISRVEVNDIVDTQRRRDRQAIPDWRSYQVA